MTSTPVSLNDESLNGSWIDINSASQIHSPIAGDDDCDGPVPPYCSASLAEPAVQNIGLMSFQVERFLQEAQKIASCNKNASTSNGNANNSNNNTNASVMIDNISDICMSSDSDASGQVSRKDMVERLKLLRQHVSSNMNNTNNQTNNNLSSTESLLITGGYCYMSDVVDSSQNKVKRNGDQLSDSLSLLSRASAPAESTTDIDFQDSDWLWDWTAQPEYFGGQEWKVTGRKKEYLMKQRQLYDEHNNNMISREMLSLLFLTNILSIIIGAGITYSMLMRRSNF